MRIDNNNREFIVTVLGNCKHQSKMVGTLTIYDY